MNILKVLSVAIVICMFQIGANAQLTITSGQTAAWYIQNVLLGSGVTVSNISSTITTNPANIGQFSNGYSTNLNVSAGLILSSGDITLAPGPNTQQGATGYSGSGSDAELTAIATDQVYDAAVLEFDFVPVSNVLGFEYVFASDEYPEFVNSTFNDVFGFFVSGPNPAGGNYVNYNIALVPGTTSPVAINNVNNGTASTGPCTNCQYYYDNTSGTTIEYDGFTTLLNAVCNVIPCQTYHIKLAIGDVGDDAYDSGVFLNAGSFSSMLAPLMVSDYTPTTCSNGTTNIYVNGGTSPYTYLWSTGATTPNITAPAGTYYVTVTDSSCTPLVVVDTIYISQVLSTAPVAASSSSSFVCNGDSTVLTVTGGSIGTAANWNWYTGNCGGNYVASSDSLIYSPTISSTYYVRAEGVCNTTICVSIYLSLKDHSIIPTSVSATASPINPGISTFLSQSGGMLGTSANWYWYENSCGGNIVGYYDTLTLHPSATTTYYLRAEGVCNTTSCLSITIVVFPTSISNESIDANKITFYPNPFKSTFTIKIKESNATLNIYNISGILVKEVKLKQHENTINTKEFPKGEYMLELITAKNKYRYKIVKE